MYGPSWELCVSALQSSNADKEQIIGCQRTALTALTAKVKSLEEALMKKDASDASWEGDAALELVEAVLAWKKNSRNGARYPKCLDQLKELELSLACRTFVAETPNAFEVAATKAKGGRAKRRKTDDLYVISVKGGMGPGSQMGHTATLREE